MLEVGASFDRYRIEAVIGAGGMGQVYRAFDTRLQRRVALKVLKAPDDLGPTERADAVARLLREARAAAALEHPNVVAIYDVGKVDEAIPYLTKATKACTPLSYPIPYVRSNLFLGMALAKKGDKAGACAAYAVVLKHWGKAKPRSVSAEQARKLSRELGCPAR